MDTTALNAAVMATFAEPVTFGTGGGEVTLSGVIERPAPPLGAGAAPTGTTARLHDGGSLLISVLTSDLDTAGVQRRDRATVDGLRYVVADLWPDGGGVTVLEMRS